MNFGIDLDDVLGNFHTCLRLYHNNVYGTSLKVEDFKSYAQHILGPLEESIRKVNDFQRSEYFKQIIPLTDSLDAIKVLSQKNRLFIITARPSFVREETERWVDQFFNGNFSGIFYSSNHYSGEPGKQKSEICKDLGVSVMVDDSLDYLVQCAAGGIKGVLFDYPWNQNGHLPPQITRVKNWQEALERLT